MDSRGEVPSSDRWLMLKGKKHASELAEAHRLLAGTRESGRRCPYPVFHISDGSTRVGGLFLDAAPSNPQGSKRFELDYEDGNGIAIADLVDARLLFRHPDGYYEPYSADCILEPAEARDVFIFALKARARDFHDLDLRKLQPTSFMPPGDATATETYARALYQAAIEARRVQPTFGQEMLAEYYDVDGTPKSRVDGSCVLPAGTAAEWLSNAERLIDAELFHFALFHNQDLVWEAEGVYSPFRVGRNIQAVYVKPNPAFEGNYLELPSDLPQMPEGEPSGEPPYAYWRYADGDSCVIGKGWTMDLGLLSTPRSAAIRGIGVQQAAPQLTDPEGQNVIVRYHFEPSLMFAMLDQYAHEHGTVSRCENLFPDDTSRNYQVHLSPDNREAMGFIALIFNLAPSLAGSHLFWADLDAYYTGTRCLDVQLRLMNAAERTREAHFQLLRLLYEKCEEPFDETRLPARVSECLVSGGQQIQALRRYRESEDPEWVLLEHDGPVPDVALAHAERLEAYAKRCTAEFAARRAQAEASFRIPKWRTELTLFEMVRSYFPDAVYQYKADWLGRQSLDVAIPSLGVAIEYQGRQHYKSHEHLGGKAALEKSRERDSAKRQGCEARGIRLLEWPYWIPLSSLTLLNLLGDPPDHVIEMPPPTGSSLGMRKHSDDGEDWRSLLETIDSAILGGACIRFAYVSASGEKSSRTIRPREMNLGKLRVRGFCLLRSAERDFAILRMREVRTVDEDEIVATSIQLSRRQRDVRDAMSRKERLLIFGAELEERMLPALLHLSDLILSHKVESALVVAPASQLPEWERGIGMLSPERHHLVREGARFVSYEKLSRKNSSHQKDCARSWDFIVLDEGQRISNPSASCTQYFVGRGKALGLASRAEYRYLFVETCLDETLSDHLWSPMRFLLGDEWMSWRDFKDRHLAARDAAGSLDDCATADLLAIVGQYSHQTGLSRTGSE